MQYRSTGEIIQRTRPGTYRNIIAYLAEDVSENKIARICKVSPKTVAAVRLAQAVPIAARKEQLRDLHTRIALNGGEQIEDAVAAGKFTPQQLPTVVGISTDKVVQLSDAPSTKIDVTISAPNILAELSSIAQDIRSACSTLPDLEAELVDPPRLADAAPAAVDAPVLP